MASGGSASSSSGGGGAALQTPKPLSDSLEDSCSCRRANATHAVLRTCAECINIALRSGLPCAISSNGDCLAYSEVQWLYKDQPNSSWYSSITTRSYCGADDSVCKACRLEWSLDPSSANRLGSSAAPPFRACVGSDGCVCLAICEGSEHRTDVTCPKPLPVDTPLPTTAPVVSPASIDTTSSSAAGPLGDYVWLVVFFLLFLLMSIWSYQQTHVDENGLITTSYMRLFRGRKKRETPLGPPLSLEGWLGYREQLIQAERAGMLDGKPALKKVLTTNGPDVTVEAGEGYRPVSPSHAVVTRQPHHLGAMFGL